MCNCHDNWSRFPHWRKGPLGIRLCLPRTGHRSSLKGRCTQNLLPGWNTPQLRRSVLELISKHCTHNHIWIMFAGPRNYDPHVKWMVLSHGVKTKHDLHLNNPIQQNKFLVSNCIPLTHWRRTDFATTRISHRPQPKYTRDYSLQQVK